MAEVTVKQLAEMVGVSVDRLLEQMKEAGISGKNDGAAVSEPERQTLLNHLKRSHGEDAADGEPKKITLKRKTTSQLKVSGASGKKTVNVEVRKKRTYVKRSEVDAGEQTETVDEAALAEQKAEEVRLEEERQQQQAKEQATVEAEQSAKDQEAAEAKKREKEAEEAKLKKQDEEAAAKAKQIGRAHV